MDGQDGDWRSVSFPVQLWPGPRTGSWRVQFSGATILEFSTALDLLRWLEGLHRRDAQSRGGLR